MAHPVDVVARSLELASAGRSATEVCECEDRFQNTGRCDWSHPRYAFTNTSRDIREIFCAACDLLGLRWTASANRTIYVSRKDDVALLDLFAGPKR